MHAEHVVKTAGQYQVIAGAGDADFRLYRNRVRLLPVSGVWNGRLDEDDLLELEGEKPLSLQVMHVDQGYDAAHPRNDAAQPKPAA